MDDRNSILEKLIEKETGKIVNGAAIWEEIEDIAWKTEDEGKQWITGQDDPLAKWEYYVDIKRTYEEEYDQWFTDVSLLEVRLEDRKLNKTWHIQVQGATL